MANHSITKQKLQVAIVGNMLKRRDRKLMSKAFNAFCVKSDEDVQLERRASNQSTATSPRLSRSDIKPDVSPEPADGNESALASSRVGMEMLSKMLRESAETMTQDILMRTEYYPPEDAESPADKELLRMHAELDKFRMRLLEQASITFPPEAIS
eukprot:CAMPEP_0114240004 /NCGR_PEP_ID=MMETSP0058-20121206/8783_1 /TAXON_ID=36894 /ORGANISM="Pyramimonas parkeae, CCMP726" /LENGTH=154 /DNA_ID=CAMNT_0001352265 /DNA_START=104 /DNA_END=568 /DNA_ORIENTATION=+